MADLQDAAVGFGGLDEAVGGGQVGGDGFFDQHIDAGVEQCATYVGMGGCRHGDDSGVGFPGEFAEVGEREASIGGRNFRGAGRVSIDYGDEIGARGLLRYADVIAAEVTHADDGYAWLGHKNLTAE